MKLDKIILFVMMLLMGMSPQKACAQSYELSQNVIKLSGGLSFVTSKVYLKDEFGKTQKYTWKPGVSALFEYEHVTKSGWGVGWNIIYNETHYPPTENNTKDHQALRQYYIGPSAVHRRMADRRWCTEGAIGLGYAYLGGDMGDKSGVGFLLKAGIEYMLSSHIGIGAELNEVMVFTGESNKYLRQAFPNENIGIGGTFRLDLAAGIRFYF